jgi:hypothetical protein
MKAALRWPVTAPGRTVPRTDAIHRDRRRRPFGTRYLGHAQHQLTAYHGGPACAYVDVTVDPERRGRRDVLDMAFVIVDVDLIVDPER